eukprot:TRINITY_DN1760_c0_g1_i6.p1 TRINITY_DN1760_c0_g1~~TRINITY_DN1760_c0_g1_i6.p1  ORF type:complete len:169 (+),score=44.10 TRINITY_DN1760_c0_g1_i6:194-700(+)
MQITLQEEAFVYTPKDQSTPKLSLMKLKPVKQYLSSQLNKISLSALESEEEGKSESRAIWEMEAPRPKCSFIKLGVPSVDTPCDGFDGEATACSPCEAALLRNGDKAVFEGAGNVRRTVTSKDLRSKRQRIEREGEVKLRKKANGADEKLRKVRNVQRNLMKALFESS